MRQLFFFPSLARSLPFPSPRSSTPRNGRCLDARLHLNETPKANGGWHKGELAGIPALGAARLRDEPAASQKINLRHRPLRKVAPSGSKTPHEAQAQGKKKGQGEEKNPQDLSLHRRRLNKRPGEVDYFFHPPHAPFPAFPSLSSLLLSSIVVSLARRPGVQAEMSPWLPPSWF